MHQQAHQHAEATTTTTATFLDNQTHTIDAHKTEVCFSPPTTQPYSSAQLPFSQSANLQLSPLTLQSLGFIGSLREYKATGGTPVPRRVEAPSPSALPRTRPHDDIKGDVRRNLSALLDAEAKENVY